MSDEVAKAQNPETEDTIFGKITRGEIPTQPVYKDDKCMVIKDLSPQAPVHMLVLPIKPLTQLSKAEDCDTELLGHLLQVARKVAKEAELEKGYRIVINDGVEGAQSVYHLHVHILGGRQMNWPPG